MAAEQKEEEEETSGGIYWKKTGYNMKLSNVSQTVTYEKENLSFRQFASANVSIPFGGSLTWEVAVQVCFLFSFFLWGEREREEEAENQEV